MTSSKKGSYSTAKVYRIDGYAPKKDPKPKPGTSVINFPDANGGMQNSPQTATVNSPQVNTPTTTLYYGTTGTATTGGYYCGCGAWVQYGTHHTCMGYVPQLPVTYYYTAPIDITPITDKLEELLKEIKDLKKELAKRK